MAAIGVILTIENNQNLKNKELLNDLDQKSEWRKELMNIAARPSISTKDVYRVLASLRFLPKTKIEIYGKKVNKKCVDEESINKFLNKNKDKDFDVISNYIYNKLIEILKKRYEKNNSKIDEKWTNTYLPIQESEEIRLYILFLLKHHWEYNQSKKKKKKFINIESEEEKFKDYKIPINSANKDLKHCIKKKKKNKEELIVRNLTLDKKGCKTILKGQYKSNK